MVKSCKIPTMISKMFDNVGVVAPEKCPKLGFQATPWTPLAAFLQPILQAAGEEWTHEFRYVAYVYTYGGFHKWGYPQMDGLRGKIPLKWMISGYPHLWKHSYVCAKSQTEWQES